MKFFSISLSPAFLVLAVLTLTACGGNGNKTSAPEASPSSSSGLASSSAVATSSKSSSTASAKLACTDKVGDVFINSTCAGWSDASIYERYTAAPATSREIRNSGLGDLITQKIINSGNAGHDQVLDIQYNSRSPELNGIVRMFNLASAPDGVDMSGYATGKLIFDVKVMNVGDDNPDLEVVIECGWPCNTHTHPLKVTKLNTWQTFELSIKDLINEGLDIKHVATGFLIVPTWGRQANVHFQLDNIRWVKGAPEPVTETVCFANHMGSRVWTLGSSTYILNLKSFTSEDLLSYDLWLGQVAPDIALRPQWSSVSDSWGFAISELLDSASYLPLESPSLSECASQGTLSAQVHLPASYVADGNMRVGLYIMDFLGVMHKFTAASRLAATMKPNDWTKLQVNLQDFPTIYNAASVGVFFEANGKLPSVSGDIRIDNFVISRSVTP